MLEGQSIRFFGYCWVVSSVCGHFNEGVVPICLLSSAKASWFTSNSLSRFISDLFIDQCIQQTWLPVMHVAVFGACLIYLYRVEVLPTTCVHLQSTYFRVSCGDIVEISFCGVRVRCVIPPFPGSFWQSSQSCELCRFRCPHKNEACPWSGHCGF